MRGAPRPIHWGALGPRPFDGKVQNISARQHALIGGDVSGDRTDGTEADTGQPGTEQVAQRCTRTSHTARAIGAAVTPPSPPCSTRTTTTYRFPEVVFGPNEANHAVGFLP